MPAGTDIGSRTPSSSLVHLEEHGPGIRSAGEQVLTTDRYPDYAVAGVAYEGNVARITIRDHGDSGLTALVRVVVEDDGEGERTLDFTVRGTEVLAVAGRVRSVEIDPAWYTLDVDRKNNHHPRRLNWVLRQHSRHEADLVGIDLRLFELSSDALSLGGGVGYWSTGMVSYRAERRGRRPGSSRPRPAAGSQPLPRWGRGPMPRQSCRCRAARASRPSSRGTGAEDWSGSLALRQPLRTPLEVGTRPTLYDSGLSLAAGLDVDQRPALEPWIALESARLPGAVPHFASLRQRFTVLPRAGTWSLQSSLAAAVPLRIVPRVYLVPSVDLGADWRLFGIGTAPPEGVASGLRAGGRSEAGGQPATGRAHGGLELLVPLVGGREDRLLDLVVFRSLTAALYFEAENRFTALPALGDGTGIESACGDRAERGHYLADRLAHGDRRRARRSLAHRRRPVNVAGLPVGEPAAPPLHPAAGRLTDRRWRAVGRVNLTRTRVVSNMLPTMHTYLELEVSLLDIDPRIWRRFQLGADDRFGDLHLAIQDSFDWDKGPHVGLSCGGPGPTHACRPRSVGPGLRKRRDTGCVGREAHAALPACVDDVPVHLRFRGQLGFML